MLNSALSFRVLITISPISLNWYVLGPICNDKHQISLCGQGMNTKCPIMRDHGMHARPTTVFGAKEW
eukprot:scaffold681851_cov106-Prasinocladus_malaysianus.AAC.1